MCVFIYIHTMLFSERIKKSLSSRSLESERETQFRGVKPTYKAVYVLHICEKE